MLREVANLGLAGLVFGQTVGNRPFSWMLVAIGIALWLVFASVAMWLAGVDTP
jgi:type IV secretory pathway TrbD component